MRRSPPAFTRIHAGRGARPCIGRVDRSADADSVTILACLVIGVPVPLGIADPDSLDICLCLCVLIARGHADADAGAGGVALDASGQFAVGRFRIVRRDGRQQLTVPERRRRNTDRRGAAG